MQIAYFTNFYLPVVNGVVRSVETYRAALTKLGHRVFVFAQSNGHYNDQAPFVYRYPSLPLPSQIDVPAVIPISPFIDQLLPSLKLDVIHAHHPILLGQIAAIKAEKLNLPLIFTFHTQYPEYTNYFPLSYDAVQNFLKKTVKNWLKDFMHKCQHIIVPSESMKEILTREYGLRDHYTVIPTGIDLAPYQTDKGKALRTEKQWQDDFVTISVGRLAPEKNWETLLKAVAKVLQRHSHLRLVLVGDGPKKESLKALVIELGIHRRVTFVGELPFLDVVTYLKAADLFAFASVTETQGLATLEAMAAGLPVVAVEGSGTRDIVDNGENGYLVANDPESLAAAIGDLIESPERKQQLGSLALQKAKQFETGYLAQRLMGVYEQVIQDQAGGGRE